ncbi:MAG: phosphate signaling complex protein PhoU [Desulfurivibrio sp.]|nr:phosphate signaling complex protein PhoU [Desulfurivibrio sp.]MBU3937245.1 phosphate signaling complex protein PhoU [Pseudomonadota bacterium]MBU4033867.1 phosphate signaling complex protein PhoU [Pseudomonadota bacterium]MBU4117224.1 phosphate signaling complex protein PhoU [Pseudomonadota bacterium]
MPKHMQHDIDKLKAKIIAMGEAVEDRVYQATLSVINRDPGKANAVIKGDREIDDMEVDIEEDCLKILALYQPVAIDLRFIVAALKINSDLERIGDLAVNIAERGLFLAAQDKFEIPFDLSAMVNLAEKMVTESIDSLINHDVRLAHQIRAADDTMDAMNREMYTQLKGMLTTDTEHVNNLLHVLSVGRHLERIADHATNIAEDVIYLVDAQIIRHTPELYDE